MQGNKTQLVGKAFEEIACSYLENFGLTFKQSNYECKTGEIDLIMQESDTLVFVEARFRKSLDFGGPLLSVSRNKQNKIMRTAKWYLLENDLYDKVFCRFDIVTGEMVSGKLDIQWYQNAFTESFI